MAGSSLTRSAPLVLALLIITDPQFATGAPEVTYIESTVRTTVGDTAVLRCDLCGNGNYVSLARAQAGSVSLRLFKHFGFSVESNRMEAYCLQEDEVCLLRIKNVQKNDSGIYHCREDGSPPIRHSMYLSVYERGMTILGEPYRVYWKGSSINLTCEVQPPQKPQDIVLWMHNDLLMDAGSDSRLTITTEANAPTISHLLLEDVQPEDAGTYTCQLLDGRSDSFTVAVMQEPGTTILGEPLRVHWQGSSINLMCEVQPWRGPEDTILWMHNDLLVDPEHDSRLTITTDGDNSAISHLLLKNAQPEDSGTYTCKLPNGRSDSVHVDVMQVVHDHFYPTESGAQRPLAALPAAGLLALAVAAAAFSSHCR